MEGNNIILLSGYIKSGKDTVADYISYKYSYKKYSIADELKKQVMIKYNLSRDDVYTQEGKERIYNGFLTHRDLLIQEGALQRELNLNVWIDKVATNILTNTGNSVIADFRFPHEVEYIKKKFKNHNITTIRISRPGIKPLDIQSEHHLDDYPFDYVIINDGTLQDLYEKIDFITKY